MDGQFEATIHGKDPWLIKYFLKHFSTGIVMHKE